MESALIVLCLIWFGTGFAGYKLIRFATRKRAESPIPTARVTNAEGAEYAYQKSSDLAKRGSRKLGKTLGVSLGVFLIVWPILGVIWLLTVDWGFGTMGRRLRIGGRTALPRPAHGDNWGASNERASDDTSAGASSIGASSIGPSSIARPSTAANAIAAWWLEAARMEHASVPAFSRLSLQLAALGAPPRLLRATHLAALDEIRHAETCFAIARAISGEAHDAGPIVELAGELGMTSSASPPSTLSFASLAIESLVDGCLSEGIAADLAACGAELATEPAIRDALAMIARDEATHAELAWDIVAWCIAIDGTRVKPALRAQALDAAAPRTPEGDPVELARYGMVDAETATRVARARCAEVRARLATLVTAPIARAARAVSRASLRRVTRATRGSPARCHRGAP